MDSEESAVVANKQLESVYSARMGEWRALRQSRESLSIPFFLKVEPAYFAATMKCLFVGQETHGWWTDCKIQPSDLRAEQIMDFYLGARRWLHENYHRSPYWQALRHVANGLGIDAPPESFIFSNVFPCDTDKGQAPLELHEVFRKWKILADEVKILAPDIIIFFCGPRYYGNLQAYFGEWPIEPVSKVKPLIEYRPLGQSWKGLVTYHPGSLRRLQKWHVLDEIIDRLKSKETLARTQCTAPTQSWPQAPPPAEMPTS